MDMTGMQDYGMVYEAMPEDLLRPVDECDGFMGAVDKSVEMIRPKKKKLSAESFSKSRGCRMAVAESCEELESMPVPQMMVYKEDKARDHFKSGLIQQMTS